MKWVWRIGAGIILIIMVTAAGLYFTREITLTPLLKRVVTRWLEDQGGADIHIRQLQGDYLTYVRISGVRTLRPGKGQLSDISLDSLQLNYRLLDLYDGLDVFLQRMRVRLQGAHVVLRLAPPGPKPAASRKPAPGRGLGLPETWPDVLAENLALEVIAADWFIRGRGIRFRLNGEGRAQLRADRVTLFHPAVGRKQFRLDADVQASPDRVQLHRLALNGQPVAENTWVAGGAEPGELRFQAGLRLFGGRLEASGNSRSEEQTIQATLRGLDMARAAAFFPGLPSLQGTLQLDMRGLLPKAGLSGLNGNLLMRVDGARFGEWSSERLRLAVRAEKGWLVLQDLDGRFGSNAVRIWNLRVPVSGLARGIEPVLDQAHGRFRLDIRDLPGIMAKLGAPLGSWELTVRQNLVIQGMIGQGRITLRQVELEWQTVPRGLVLVQSPTPWLRLLPVAFHREGRRNLAWRRVTLITPMEVEENLLTFTNLSCGLRELVSGDFHRILRSLNGRFGLRVEDLSALLAVVGLGRMREPLPAIVDLEGEIRQGTARASGHVSAYNTDLDLRHLAVAFPFEGPLEASRIEGELVWRALDVRALAALVGISSASGALQLAAAFQGTLAHPSGRLRLNAQALEIAAPGLDAACGSLLADLNWQGAWDIPAWQGRLELQQGELRAGAGMPSIQDLTLLISLSHRQIRLEQITGALGGSYFTLRGEIGSQGGPWPFFQTRLQGENLLFYRSEGIKIRADADLNIIGPWQQLGVVGTVRLTDSRFTENYDFLDILRGSGGRPSTSTGGFQLFSITDPPLNNARFHVRVTTRNPFEIKNNLAKGALRPELLLTGTGEVPVLIGNIYIDPSTVGLPAGTLNLQSGYLRFLENAPDRPELIVNAQASLQGYDVTMQVGGPLDDPTVTLTSVPPLAEEDLLLLVLAGLPPKVPASQQPQQQQQAALNVAVYLGLNYITRLFGSSSTEAQQNIFDRLQIQVGQRLYQATLVQTLYARYLLASGLLLPNDQVFMTSERDIYGDYNLGLRESFKFK